MINAQLLAWCKEYTASMHAWSRPLIMGVLNSTPDSFSDAGNYFSPEKALKRALEMVKQGADLLDIGGESSRPSAVPVSLDEELVRVIPVIEAIRQESDICISIDTCKPEVMTAAVAAGAGMINDIYALTKPQALETAAALQIPVCLMHMQGSPLSMQRDPQYSAGVLEEIHAFFAERLQACLDAGIEKNRIILDPGFGFGKNIDDNLRIVAKLEHWKDFQCPLLLGVSRKSTIGALLNKPVNARLFGSLALAIYAVCQGANIIRTHDVDETRQVLLMIDCIKRIA